MCFELDSVPPIPVVRGAAVSHEHLVLEAADGNRFAAFSAAPDDGADVGVVLLPDVRGLYRFYEELALRFAERGYAAVAIDYFGRTAGVARATRSSSTWSTSSRRRPRASRPTSRAAVAALREQRSARGLHRRLLLRRPQLVARGRGRPRARRRRRLLRPPGRARRLARADQRAAEIEAPILALQAGDDAEHHRRRQRRVRRGAHRGGCRARGRDATTAHRTASSTASRRSSRQLRTTRGRKRSRSSPPTRADCLTRGGATRACRRKRRCGARSHRRPPHAGPRGVRHPGPSNAHS